ncbi:hypothetical protein ACFWUW_24760 [Streptomyces sp. NPDC058655]|uniref:hypothetical protein n=1 Tax=Streptomyces sp. NPDC058655 TaxID=3346577 RepID=UPI003664C394
MSTRWSRRSFLRLSGSAALLTTVPPAAATARAADDAYDSLRARWRGMFLGSGFDPAAAHCAEKPALLGAQGP